MYRISVLFLLVLVGCSSFKDIKTFNDLNYFYGVGFGKDFNSAKKQALNDLASNISVNIKSKSSISEHYSSKDSSSSTIFNENIITSININNLQDVKIKDVSKSSPLLKVTLELSKDALRKQIKAKLDSNAKEASFLINTCNLVKLKDRQKLKELAGVIKSDMYLLKNLSSSYKDEARLIEIINLANTKQSFKLEVESKSSKNARKIQEQIQKELLNMLIISKDSKNTISLSINNQVVINILDCNNSLLESYTIPLEKDINKLSEFEISRISAMLYKQINASF